MDFNHDLGQIDHINQISSDSGVLTVSGSGGLVVPIGTDVQRSASIGILRYNSDHNYYEGYNGVEWVPFQGINSSLSGLSSLSGTGLMVQTGVGSYSVRSVLGSLGRVVVTDGSGVGNNIVIDLDVVGVSGSYVSVSTDAYGRVVSGSTSQSWSTIDSTPTTLSGYGITDAVLGSGIISFTADLFSNMLPGSMVPVGSMYYATDLQTLYYANGTSWDAVLPSYTGDVSSSGSVLTLVSVNSDIGSYGDSSHVASFTVNAKGLVTSVSEQLITPSAIGAIDSSLLGAVNGVATLDSNGKLTNSQIPDILLGSLQYIGVWDASTNTPDLSASNPQKGYYYKVSVAGTTMLDGNSSWQAGDLVIYNGTSWDGVDSTDSEVISVNGHVGTVNLVLASSDFENQGTGVTFLRGNAAGSPSWSSVNLSSDVSGTLQAAQFPALSGDISTVGGSLVTTLADVNSNIGSFGSATQVPVITVNSKGLVTAVSTATISSALSYIGDVSGSGTTGTDVTLTLASVNSDIGSFGDASHVGSFTVNAKGLVTAASEVLITSSAIGAVANNGAVPSIESDIFANIPAAGNVGAVFIATDTHAIYRDNGVSWDQVGESAVLYTENISSPVDSVVSGVNSVSIGSDNVVNSANSIVTGLGAGTSVYGASVHSSGYFAVPGDAQSGKYILRGTTSNNSVTELFLDGSGARIVLPNNSAVNYSAQIVARRTDQTGFEGAWRIEGLISRDATVSTTTLVGNRSKSILTRPADWDAEVVADTANGALTFTVTGASGQSIRWVITVTTTEVIG